MTIYQCQRCNKIFDQKSHYAYHVDKRKISCNPDIKKCSDLLDKSNINITKLLSDQNSESYLSYSTNKSKNNSELTCGFCKKSFSRKAILLKHLESTCKVKRALFKDDKQEEIFQQLIEKMERQKQELEMMKEAANANLNVNSNNTININNNSNNNNNNKTINQTIYKLLCFRE